MRESEPGSPAARSNGQPSSRASDGREPAHRPDEQHDNQGSGPKRPPTNGLAGLISETHAAIERRDCQIEEPYPVAIALRAEDLEATPGEIIDRWQAGEIDLGEEP